MPKLSRDTIAQIANLSDSDKANLFSLFDEASDTEKQLAEMRSKVPADSQQIVDKVEFTKMQEIAARNDDLKKQLADAMDKLKVNSEGLDPLAAFRPILNLFSGE